jgi:hypothetical protein
MENQAVATMEFPAIGPNASGSELKELFEVLATEWKQKSRYMSNTAQMALLWCYQRIIGMGWPAVPLILEELQRETNHWFWALEAITGENPVPRELAGDVRGKTQEWIKWGTAKGLIKP